MQHNDHTLENQMEANAAAFILSRGVFPISDCGFKQSQTYEEERIYEIVRLKAKFRKLPKKYLSKNLEDYPVRSPADFAHIAMKFIGDDDREIFLVACLSTKNKIQSLHRCQIGLLNASLVTPREVFKTAFLQNAAAIIVAHNHPSQVLTPSAEDIEVTKRLQESGVLLGVEVLDYLIVSQNGYMSFKEKDYM